MTTVDKNEARLAAHEQICALRYDGLCARLKRMETVAITVAGTIIMLLLAIVLKMN